MVGELGWSMGRVNPLGIMFVSLSEWSCCKIYTNINVDDFSIRFYDFSFI